MGECKSIECIRYGRTNSQNSVCICTEHQDLLSELCMSDSNQRRRVLPHISAPCTPTTYPCLLREPATGTMTASTHRTSHRHPSAPCSTSRGCVSQILQRDCFSTLPYPRSRIASIPQFYPSVSWLHLLRGQRAFPQGSQEICQLRVTFAHLVGFFQPAPAWR